MLTKGAKINAEAQRKQRRKEVNAKDSKRKPQITQISADFFCGICGFNNQIGENLCQSVDETNHRLHRLAQIFLYVLCKFLCPLWLFIQSV